MSAIGSMAPVFVVPALATTRNGRRPAARSSRICRRRSSTSIRSSSSVASVRKFLAREAGDLRGLRDARVRLLGHVVGAVEEVLAERGRAAP